MAQCSLSMGITVTFFSLALLITSLPAETRVSLFARAIFFPFSIAESVGTSPAKPIIALTTVSGSSREAIVFALSSPSITVTFSPKRASFIFFAASLSVTPIYFGFTS